MRRRLKPKQNRPADFGEFQVRLARDDVIRQTDNFLLLDFITHFRPAENDDKFRSNAFEKGDDLGGFRDVPNINAQTDDFRLARQDGFGDIGGPLLEVKFQQTGLGAQGAEIGHQVAQPEGGVDIPCVQSGENNRGLVHSLVMVTASTLNHNHNLTPNLLPVQLEEIKIRIKIMIRKSQPRPLMLQSHAKTRAKSAGCSEVFCVMLPRNSTLQFCRHRNDG